MEIDFEDFICQDCKKTNECKNCVLNFLYLNYGKIVLDESTFVDVCTGNVIKIIDWRYKCDE